ncbi:MAG: hypothetical protein U9N04_02945 [Patescibacteria group bacterium]|nr:hypothetical protein [Patescibacteria group bacterium]
MKIEVSRKNVIICFLFFSSLTVIAHFFSLKMANWIDIPAHFAGGMVVATFLPKKVFRKNPLRSIFVIFLIGFGWEFVEITTAKKEIMTALFQETKLDKIGDLIVGLTGFVFIYSKVNIKKVIHNNLP